jgi:integrase
MKTPESQANQALNRVGENLFRSDASGIYYAIFRRDGKQIRRSLKTKDRKLAERKLNDLRGKVERLATDHAKSLPFAEWNAEKPGELVGGLSRRWLDFAGLNLKPSSLDRRFRTVKVLSPHFKGKTVASFTMLDVERWATRRIKECSLRTFNMELETLKLVFDYAMQHGILLDNPAAKIKRRKLSATKLDIPNRDQFKALLAEMRECRKLTGACDESEAAENLLEFLAYSGCRLAEAVGDPHFGKPPMTWGDVNFELKTFTVTGKGVGGGKTRTVPLFPPLERLLLKMKAALPAPVSGDEPIFKILSSKKAIQTACRRLGLPQYSHHTFRHFFASNAIEKGIDFKVIADWLGHADGGVLVARTYGHLRAEHSARMAKRMDFDAETEEPENVVKITASKGVE